MRREPDPEELARYDVDADGQITDDDLARVRPPSRWASIGLRGPAIVLRWFTRNAKRLAVLVLGLTVLAAGLAMLVLPGPGVLIVVAGLAILATEFAWAERAMNGTLSRASRVSGAVTGNATGRAMLAISALFLIASGVVLFLLLDTWRMGGLSLVLAGVVGLAVLHPRVQRWLESKQAG